MILRIKQQHNGCQDVRLSLSGPGSRLCRHIRGTTAGKDLPEHVAMQLVLRAVNQQGWVENRQIVGIKQDDFCEAGCIQGKGLEGVAFDVCWFVVGRVWQSGGISASHVGEACL